jgi:hypothetical protein
MLSPPARATQPPLPDIPVPAVVGQAAKLTLFSSGSVSRAAEQSKPHPFGRKDLDFPERMRLAHYLSGYS